MKKCIVITGACGGLGKAFVTECVKELKKVQNRKSKKEVLNSENTALVLTGTSEKKLQFLTEELKHEFNGLQVFTCLCNLSKPEDRASLIQFIKDNNLVVARLINNAGVIIEGDLLRFEDDEILNAIKVNCEGTLDITQKIIKLKEKDAKLEILTVSSVASTYPIPHMAVYSATKAFLTSMMTALSVELKHENVVVTTVNPGGMATTDAMKASIKAMGLGGKLSTLSVEKVARIALKGLKKRKANVVPGFFNKILVAISKPFSKRFMAINSGKIYAKAQKKRNF